MTETIHTAIDTRRRKRPQQRAIAERHEPDAKMGRLYDLADRACDIGVRHMIYLHAHKYLRGSGAFMKAMKERNLVDAMLADAGTVERHNDMLKVMVDELLDQRFDLWEDLESDPQAATTVQKIESGGETKIGLESTLAAQMLEALAQAPTETFGLEGDRPFVPDAVVKEFKGEVACTIEDPANAVPVQVPLSCITSLAGFQSFNGRGSQQSADKITVYEHMDQSTVPPVPEISVVIFEDGAVMASNTDGSHRIAAAIRRGDTHIPAEKLQLYFAKTE
jgi:hypothetical protein